MSRFKKLKNKIKMKKQRILDQVKAARRGSREAELQDAHGFAARKKVHKSKKAYNRKKFRVDVND